MDSKTQTYLFVCMANMQRSPTAEDVARGLAKANGLPVTTKSAGVSPLAERPITKELAREADLIFVMEEYMKTFIIQSYGIEPGRIINLGIPDIYERDEPQLVKILTESIKPFLKNKPD
jgi:predicted protein tyrosine phosphatase